MVKVIRIFVYVALLFACAGQGHMFASVASGAAGRAGSANRIMGAVPQKSSSSLERSGSSSGEDSKGEVKPGIWGRLKAGVLRVVPTKKTEVFVEQTESEKIAQNIKECQQKNEQLHRRIEGLQELAVDGISPEKLNIIKSMPQFVDMSAIDLLSVDVDALSTQATFDLAEAQFELQLRAKLLASYNRLYGLEQLYQELAACKGKVQDLLDHGIQLAQVAKDQHNEEIRAIFKRHKVAYLSDDITGVKNLITQIKNQNEDIEDTLRYLENERAPLVRGPELVNKVNKYYENLQREREKAT